MTASIEMKVKWRSDRGELNCTHTLYHEIMENGVVYTTRFADSIFEPEQTVLGDCDVCVYPIEPEEEPDT